MVRRHKKVKYACSDCSNEEARENRVHQAAQPRWHDGCHACTYSGGARKHTTASRLSSNQKQAASERRRVLKTFGSAVVDRSASRFAVAVHGGLADK